MKFGALLALVLGACAAAPAGAPLRVASDLDNRPFAWVDASGTPQGRDVEMMQAIAERLQRPLVWQRQSFDTLLPDAQAGKVDVVCATLGVTPEREELIDFSRPYFHTQLAGVTLAGPDAPLTAADLAGRRVGAAAGTTSARALALRVPTAQAVLENEAGLTALERLQSGVVDALIMDGPAADALVASAPGVLARMPESFGVEDYALVVPPGSALLEALDQVLRTLELDGTLARLDSQHGLTARN